MRAYMLAGLLLAVAGCRQPENVPAPPPERSRLGKLLQEPDGTEPVPEYKPPARPAIDLSGWHFSGGHW